VILVIDWSFGALRYSVAMPGALEGVRIADFSRVLAGPYATMLLADLGADVVKVERPGTGDDTREWGPPYDAEGVATYFLSVNRNKRSVTIDLSTDDGRAEARSLALASDVLIENFKPGTLERMSLGFDDLHADHPRLVVCSITGFGAAEGRDLPGYDLVLQAVGGLMSITGPEPGAPTKVGVALVDVIAGLHAAVGILAALRHRDRTGEGQRVEISLLSSLLSALVNQASGFVSAGVVPGILGNAHPSIAPYEVYQVADGHFAVAVGNDRQFGALCAVIERPALAEDPRFLTNADRVRNRAELNGELSPVLSTRAGSQWFDALRAVGVPCGPINDLAGAFTFAESLGLEPVVEIAGHAGAAASRQVRNPIGLSATPPEYRLPPPRLGEHTPEP
jgi:crotonobetainyl-CoA:carnitine CoA-transferase CaiB-like acyl-CoA transferase